jgi:hypothetical protein
MPLVGVLIRFRTPATVDEFLNDLPLQQGRRPDLLFVDALRSMLDEMEKRGWLNRDHRGRYSASIDQIAVAATDAGIFGTVRENAARLPHVELPSYVPSEDE